MTVADARTTVTECAENKKLCRALFKYEHEFSYILPVSCGTDYFMSAVESGFKYDGYEIRRFADLSSAQKIEGGFADVAAREGLFDEISAPPVDVSSISDIVLSMIKLECNVVIELDSEESREVDFLTGRIVTCGSDGCAVCLFDLNARWEKTPVRINYGNIRRIVFGTGYLGLFDKYLPECPIK